jgi:hypothetical protein
MRLEMNGLVLYRGPSMIDGQPIVCIATGLATKSTNEKTGDLIQTWILRDDIAPIDAANTGADVSICGDCPHRGQVIDGKNVNRTCYVTLFHQWRKCDPAFARYVMASCDNAADYLEAKAAGYRTFRVRTAAEALRDREVICPASAEAGFKTNCAACRACGGTGAKARADIAIVVHGAAGKVNLFTKRAA